MDKRSAATSQPSADTGSRHSMLTSHAASPNAIVESNIRVEEGFGKDDAISKIVLDALLGLGERLEGAQRRTVENGAFMNTFQTCLKFMVERLSKLETFRTSPVTTNQISSSSTSRSSDFSDQSVFSTISGKVEELGCMFDQLSKRVDGARNEAHQDKEELVQLFDETHKNLHAELRALKNAVGAGKGCLKGSKSDGPTSLAERLESLAMDYQETKEFFKDVEATREDTSYLKLRRSLEELTNFVKSNTKAERVTKDAAVITEATDTITVQKGDSNGSGGQRRVLADATVQSICPLSSLSADGSNASSESAGEAEDDIQRPQTSAAKEASAAEWDEAAKELWAAAEAWDYLLGLEPGDALKAAVEKCVVLARRKPYPAKVAVETKACVLAGASSKLRLESVISEPTPGETNALDVLEAASTAQEALLVEEKATAAARARSEETKRVEVMATASGGVESAVVKALCEQEEMNVDGLKRARTMAKLSGQPKPRPVQQRAPVVVPERPRRDATPAVSQASADWAEKRPGPSKRQRSPELDPVPEPKRAKVAPLEAEPRAERPVKETTRGTKQAGPSCPSAKIGVAARKLRGNYPGNVTICAILCPPCVRCEDRGQACIVVDAGQRSTCTSCTSAKAVCQTRSLTSYFTEKAKARIAALEEELRKEKKRVARLQQHIDELEEEISLSANLCASNSSLSPLMSEDDLDWLGEGDHGGDD